MCAEDDLKSIGIPLGPRKKILKFVAERQRVKAAAPTDPQPISQQMEGPATLPAIERLSVQPQFERQYSWYVVFTTVTISSVV